MTSGQGSPPPAPLTGTVNAHCSATVRRVSDAPSTTWADPLSATQAPGPPSAGKNRIMTTTSHPDPKAMARLLRAALADRGVTVGHGEALELVARQLGARDWNTLAATSSAMLG